jgi:hypothetical protein
MTLGSGQPLSKSGRDFFEPRFGADFSLVRIHADRRAAEMAQSVNAKAFTIGKDIFFGAKQYVPETAVGKKLLAHELTHVAQQTFATELAREGYLVSQLLRTPLYFLQRSSVEDLGNAIYTTLSWLCELTQDVVPPGVIELAFRHVHGADNPLAIQFLRNYMAGERTKITLTGSQMRNIQPSFGIESHYDGYSRNDRRSNPQFERKLSEVINSGVESIPIDIRSLGFAALRGTLGCFTVNWQGSLRWQHRESAQYLWSFAGEIFFTDTWNLNPSNRRSDVEMDVRIGNCIIPGHGFPIDSVRLHAEQTGTLVNTNGPNW